MPPPFASRCFGTAHDFGEPARRRESENQQLCLDREGYQQPALQSGREAPSSRRKAPKGRSTAHPQEGEELGSNILHLPPRSMAVPPVEIITQFDFYAVDISLARKAVRFPSRESNSPPCDARSRLIRPQKIVPLRCPDAGGQRRIAFSRTGAEGEELGTNILPLAQQSSELSENAAHAR